jgi:enoyl-CoA hydratase
LLKELDDAFLRAEADDQVRVVILGGHGRSFSSGHDMAFMTRAQAENPDLLPWEAYFGSGRGTSRKGREGHYLAEWHYFFTNTLRWRNLRKVTIAQVQGTVYAAGLMLMWACDLIVGADDANFVDVVGTRLGMCGVEYFAHPWEFGARKTKELMLTGDALTVEEAHRLGMVSKVFPRPDLEERTLEFARRIAALPTVTALLIKESVNQTQDNMGFQNALQACFSLHQLNHGHWAEMAAAGEPRDPALEAWRSSPGVRPAVKDQVAAPVSIR